jgi:hypothetical protein
MSEVAGLEMVAVSVRLCRFTLGNRIPRVVSSVSRMADGFGVPGWGEIFTPWAWMAMLKHRNRVVEIRCFIVEDLS